MTPSWGPIPQFKVVVDPLGTPVTYENDQAFNLIVTRPENNISSAILQVNDYRNKNYDTVFDPFSLVDIYFGYSGSYTKVLRGWVHTVAPKLSMDGETLEVGIWGNGWGLLKTHCDTSYGVESINPTLYQVQEIITDIANNYVEQQFCGVMDPTGWTLAQTKIEDVLNTLSITFLDGRYTDNFTLFNKVCDIATAYAWETATVGPHWMVDTSDNLYLKLLNADSADTVWRQFWKGTGVAADEANSTLTVTQDMILYDFKKHMSEYANDIVLCTDFRKPGYDTWTEGQATDTYWGETNINTTQDAFHIVGGSSLKGEGNAAATGRTWYPKASTAHWNFTKCESVNTIPTLNFYVYMERDLGAFFSLQLRTDTTDDYYYVILGGPNGILNQVADEWIHVKLPIGTYWHLADEARRFRWAVGGAGATPLWTDINDICFEESGTVIGGHFFIDDLHFAGKVIRRAIDTSEVTTYKDHQKIIINDLAVDDTLRSGGAGTTDVGTAARLARAELHRRATLPLTGMIKIPLAIDFLPGQKTHIHACLKGDGTFAVDSTAVGCFRAVEVTHTFGREGAFTTLNLTNDVTNSHAKAVPTQASLLAEYVGALGHREAKNLKGGGIDPLIPRLTESY